MRFHPGFAVVAVIVVVVATGLLPVAAAHAAGVAYIDGGQVIGVRNVPGRQGQYATFAVWQPDGTLTDQGPLQNISGYSVRPPRSPRARRPQRSARPRVSPSG